MTALIRRGFVCVGQEGHAPQRPVVAVCVLKASPSLPPWLLLINASDRLPST
jgi:hypothetical protein